MFAGDLGGAEVATPAHQDRPRFRNSTTVQYKLACPSAIPPLHFVIAAMSVDSPDVGCGSTGKHGPTSRHHGRCHPGGQTTLGTAANRIDGSSGGKKPTRLLPVLHHRAREARTDQLRVRDQPKLAG